MKNIIAHHRFFVKESKSFVDLKKWSNKLYYPIAYIKFMYYSLKPKQYKC
jgi:hypothetical protein